MHINIEDAFPMCMGPILTDGYPQGRAIRYTGGGGGVWGFFLSKQFVFIS